MSKELIKRILSSIVLIPIVFFFILKGSVLFNFFLLICFFIAVFEWHMMSKRKFYHIIGIIFCDLISPDKSAVTKQAVAEAVDSKLKYFLL